MKDKKQKYYVVWKGVNPGVYKDWESAKQQINGYEGAQYKSFATLNEANLAYTMNPYNFIGKKVNADKINPIKNLNKEGILPNSICVDAACSGNPGDMEYRGVETLSGKEIFHMGPLKNGTNNVGEFLGLVHALALLKKKDLKSYVIYTDSKTAIAWVRNKKAKTTLERLPSNRPVFELLERAIDWLNSNAISNQILHWNTKAWGEIPADFGRK
jgi:ribonuclease HI